MQELPPGAHRRQVLRATAALSATAATVAAGEAATAGAATAAPHTPPVWTDAGQRHRGRHGTGRGHRGRHDEDRIALRATGAGDLRAVTIALGTTDFHEDHRGTWVSRSIPTTAFTMAALTWAATAGPADTSVRVRTPGREGWRAWHHLPAVEDGPDGADAEGGTSAPRATSLAWMGSADAVEVRVTGAVPADLRLHLVLSQPTLADHTAERRTVSARSSAYRRGLPRHAALGAGLAKDALIANIVPQPTILSRAAWGANEAWRSGSPRYNDTIAQTHIHHTATSNGYADTEVPALIRGMYYYHTHTLGWSDIAYNFLVDIFGRIWEGRYGGIDQPVRGAHTLGFNAQSTGFSVIGNYELIQPSSAVLDSLSKLAAWKLYPYGRDPLGVVAVTSEGSDKFKNGATVTLPVIDGHRDTNDTACPGDYVYAQLQNIRDMTKLAMGQGTITVTTPFAVVGSPVVGQTLTVQPGAYSPADSTLAYTWQRDGTAIPGATLSTYVVAPEDVGHVVGVVVTLSRSEYVTLSQPPALTATQVVSPPALKLRGVGHSDGRMRVKVTIDAPGVKAAGGQLVVVANLAGVKHKRVLRVGKGVGVARFVGLPPGQYYVSAAYSGTARVQAARVHEHVKIPRRGKA